MRSWAELVSSSRRGRGHARRLVVHSGTFKTGSTSIQAHLARTSGRLAEHGMLYATAGRPPNIVQHSNLVAELKGWRAYAAAFGGWDDVLDELEASGLGTAVVSTESMSLLSGDEIAEIGRRCAARGVGITWVHYVREHSSLINAYYVERLMVMRPEFADLVSRPFEDFLDWSPVPLDFLRYADFAATIIDAIPGADVRFRPFARPLLEGGDVVTDFLATIRTDAEVDPATSRQNVGAGWRTAELARFLTPLLRHADISSRVEAAANPVTARLRSISMVRRAVMEAATAAGWNRESAVYCTPDARDRFRSMFAEDDARLRDLVGVDMDEVAAATVDRPVNAGRLEDVPGDELLPVLARVLPAVVSPPLPEELR